MITTDISFQDIDNENNSSIFDAITPTKIFRYLMNKNWYIVKNIDYLPIVNFALKENKFRQVIVPKEFDKTYEYRTMIFELANKLSNIYNKNKEQILNEIVNVDKYIIEIKYKNVNNKSFNIPAHTLNTLIGNAKKLYLSAYSDALFTNDDSKPYRRGIFPSEVRNIEKVMEFGQTRPGSYIIPLLIPIEDTALRIHGTDIFEVSGIDFEKESAKKDAVDNNELAIEKMIASIENVKKIVDEKKDFNDLIDVKSENFVSVDFLNALGEITDHNEDISIDISIELKKKKKNVSTMFTPKYTSKVSRFVEEFKQKDKNYNVYFGKLYTIAIDPHEDLANRKKIIVRIEGTAMNSPVQKQEKLICEFNYDLYSEKVIDALKQGKFVKVIGEREKDKLINCEIEVIY